MFTMVFDQHFAVRPVGQGLFYTGKVSLSGDTWNSFLFSMVFDCGSMDKTFADLELAEWLEKLDESPNRDLDLLVISHFDKDHVSHVKALVKGRKVRRLVMPFLGFAERLVLSLRLMESLDGAPGTEDLAVIGFVLNPIGSIGDSLDGDSEVYLVESGPEPVNPEALKAFFGGPEELLPENTFQDENIPREAEFDYPGKQLLGKDDYFGNTESRARVYKVMDSHPAYLSSKTYLLMDFIFYKKKLGEKDEAFFKAVGDLFEKKYSASTHVEVLAALQSIASATPIRNLFDQAARSLGMPLTVTGNLNTTSLCMMHRNLRGIYELMGIPSEPDRALYFGSGHLNSLIRSVSEGRCKEIPRYDFAHYRYDFTGFSFPNTLLTSDAPLLGKTDLKNFIHRYRAFLPEVFIVQVPHHGSEKNSDKEFFKELAVRSDSYLEPLFFSNFGLYNRSGHPTGDTRQILESMPANRYFPVHEIHGINWQLFIHRYSN